MALPVRKSYKGAPASTVLTSGVNDSPSTINLSVEAIVNWPLSYPYFAVVDPGTVREEKVKVTGVTGSSLNVVRGVDDTARSQHDAGAVVYPVFTATEADEANQIASAMITKGDLIATNGTDINRLAIGTNTHVLQADSTATNGFKWGQVATTGIADGAVTSGKILDGTIVDTDISPTAAIALSKLNTGSLPTGITVASTNIVNGSLLTTDFDTTTAVASGGVPVVTVSTSAATGGKDGDVWIVV